MAKFILLFISSCWLGMVLGISFVEAPLKFQAPGITTALGLGIGKIVFGALNKFEWFYALLILSSTSMLRKELPKALIGTIAFVVGILIFQTFFLIPVLVERADLIIGGTEPPSSWHHIAFIILECIKLISLCFIFWKAYKHIVPKT